MRRLRRYLRRFKGDLLGIAVLFVVAVIGLKIKESERRRSRMQNWHKYEIHHGGLIGSAFGWVDYADVVKYADDEYGSPQVWFRYDRDKYYTKYDGNVEVVEIEPPWFAAAVGTQR